MDQNSFFHRAYTSLPLSFLCSPVEHLGYFYQSPRGDWSKLKVVKKGARGSATHLEINPIDFMAQILAPRPQALFLVHNHPSGYVFPSREDLDFTRKMVQLSSIIGLNFLGHMIVTETSFHVIDI